LPGPIRSDVAVLHQVSGGLHAPAQDARAAHRPGDRLPRGQRGRQPGAPCTLRAVRRRGTCPPDAAHTTFGSPGTRAGAQCECADVVGEAALLAAVGAGLGAREAATAALAAQRLGADAAVRAADVRFWGKVLGVHADHYVFEATLRPADAAAGAARLPPRPQDPRFLSRSACTPGLVCRMARFFARRAPGIHTRLQSGPHACVTARAHTGEAEAEAAGGTAYFVCDRLGAPLARLPRAGPAHIAAAQRVKRFLTGRLDARVASYPPFAGSEAHLLAAQARPRRAGGMQPRRCSPRLRAGYAHGGQNRKSAIVMGESSPSLDQAAPSHSGRRSIDTQRYYYGVTVWLARRPWPGAHRLRASLRPRPRSLPACTWRQRRATARASCWRTDLRRRRSPCWARLRGGAIATRPCRPQARAQAAVQGRLPGTPAARHTLARCHRTGWALSSCIDACTPAVAPRAHGFAARQGGKARCVPGLSRNGSGGPATLKQLHARTSFARSSHAERLCKVASTLKDSWRLPRARLP